MRTSNERGIALIATLLIMLLMSALMVGFTTVVMSDQKFRGIDRDRTQAFYGAHSGLEKMTVDLYNLFSASVAPTAGQLTTLTTSPPTIPGIAYTAADGTNGLKIVGQAPVSAVISSGTSPYQGLIALKTIYDIDSTARTNTGGEVHLTRRVETVAIPVFQFGMFSSVDLAFNAAGDFDFGGRVHSNANVYIASGGGFTLWLRDRVTAVGEIVRKAIPNGNLIANTGHTGTVNMVKGTGVYRALADTEGSVTSGVTSSLNSSWPTISLSTYNSYIRNGRTGARALNLPLITSGGENIDLVRRPPQNENITKPNLLAERMYSRASLRILLSDTAASITTMPGIITATPPVQLDGSWITTPPNNGTAYGPVDATHPPVAQSPGTITATTAAGSTTSQVNVTAMPAFYQPVILTIAGVVPTVQCSGRTPSSFLGCKTTSATVTGSIPANSAKAVSGAAMNGVVPAPTATTNTAAITVPISTSGAPVTIPVTANSATRFAPTWFWIGTTNGGPATTLVNCTGTGTSNTAPNAFTGCTGLAAAPGNPRNISTNVLSTAGTSTIGGFIKIELKRNDGTYVDVTMEILNYGIGGPNLMAAGSLCADPTPNAIVRLQRLRDNTGACNYAGSTNSWDYWPNTLFDPREALQRDVDPGINDVILNGVMHYVNLDTRNLSLWFQAAGAYAGGSGASANNDGGAGYSVYFSDRRNNRNAASAETGEYGWEDFINPENDDGAPNNVLDGGEDLNANSVLDVYGARPNYNGVYNTAVPGSAAPLDVNATPLTEVTPAIARVNRAILFRRALKLSRGDEGLVTPGLTIVSENPVYVEGDYNATQAAGFTGVHVAASVIADAVTFLSNNWNDANSFGTAANPSPFTMSNRRRSQHSYYRLGVIGGKNQIFPAPPGVGNGSTFGTDGGAHAFLRFIEDDSAGAADAIHFSGSLVTFYFHRQANSVFKGGNVTVYDPPATRDFVFDTDFLNPAKLPPLTPVFRDLDALGFAEEKRPGI